MAVDPEKTVRKIVSLPKDLWAEVEDFRFAQRTKTESEAIRRLISIGLKATKAGFPADDDN